MQFENIKDTFTEIFLSKSEIIAAYIYGSFLRKNFFEDIDIGILINDDFKPDVLYEFDLAGKLEKKLKNDLTTFKPIDLRILNGMPLRFLFSIFKDSKILFSRDDFTRVKFESKVVKEYLDIKPHHELYDKMRELKYASRQRTD